jgi:hypothetical protein
MNAEMWMLAVFDYKMMDGDHHPYASPAMSSEISPAM